MKMKRQVALSVISAFLIGLLPTGNPTVSKAWKDPISAEPASSETAGGTARASYGLNNPTADSDGVTTWDCVWFGSYWQEDTNGDGKTDKKDKKQPIKWRVLSVDGDDAFLLADKNLDVQRYNYTFKEVTWETCTMRSWLNGYGAGANLDSKDYSRDNFLDYAFTPTEQSAIRTTHVVNDDSPKYGTGGGNATSDQIYLLSLDEVMDPLYGFTSNGYSTKTRQAANTSYAAGVGKVKYAYMRSSGKAENWWLRSPGYGSNFASGVARSGSVSRIGNHVYFDNYAVRPALHLNLKASSDARSAPSWSYAGKVTSVGKPVSVKLKQKKRTVTASWKKVSGAAGYQIWYSTSKKWKGKKQKLLGKNKVTVKNLVKNKTYYFRVCAYQLAGTKKVYGEWSKTTKIKMKKSKN